MSRYDDADRRAARRMADAWATLEAGHSAQLYAEGHDPFAAEMRRYARERRERLEAKIAASETLDDSTLSLFPNEEDER